MMQQRMVWRILTGALLAGSLMVNVAMAAAPTGAISMPLAKSGDSSIGIDDKPLTPQDFDAGKANFYLQKVKEKAPRSEVTKKLLAPHMLQFVEQYEQVKWYKDMDALEAVLHPASKACENESNKDYFRYIRHFYLTEILPREYHLQILPVSKEKQWALKQKLNFPLPPTHLLYMEYKDGEYIEGIQRFLREETSPEPRVYELMKCPDEATIEQFREAEGLIDFSAPPEYEEETESEGDVEGKAEAGASQ